MKVQLFAAYSNIFENENYLKLIVKGLLQLEIHVP